MNQKKIPGILTSWEYICNEECRKAIEGSLEYFEKHVTEIAEN